MEAKLCTTFNVNRIIRPTGNAPISGTQWKEAGTLKAGAAPMFNRLAIDRDKSAPRGEPQYVDRHLRPYLTTQRGAHAFTSVRGTRTDRPGT